MAHIRRRAALVMLVGWAALLVAHANEDTIQLRSGLRMPANGLGTCCRKTARGQPIIDATKAYLRLGGRLIDTAMAYRNHEEVGEALRASGVKREDVWITSKLASGTVNSYAKGISAIDNILQEIGTPYLDLVLIHSPKMGRDKAVAVWKALIDARKAGKVRAIGVSNFNAGEIKDLVDNTGELPEVNQIQYHPWSSPAWHAAVAAWAGQGVVTTAYNSLGGARFATSGLAGSTVARIAQDRGMTVNAVLLAWARSKGCAVIPGSSTPQHIAENLRALDELLTPSEVRAIDESPAPDGWWSPRGPNKYGDDEARAPWHDAAAKPSRRRHHRMEH